MVVKNNKRTAKNFFLLLIIFLFFSCKKNDKNFSKQVNIQDITNEGNYAISTKKENDSPQLPHESFRVAFSSNYHQ
ncbi:hypothetical protein CEY12_10350 [Chryseobacterium sp. T16E-39]|uniref:hypothetical protein n=1 Tax=Chryseobacterium sp. T16E-39 TaxID=2015076 RepID=UPI000B5B11C6|nr:hypothetical protein [Chryseobacterium sp. T16E-39]ASK30483.1 hypothetical protein CEY12_10350 [Chryseobacterium sp. T16E-39]